MQSNHSLRSGHKLRQFCLTMDLNITSFSSICTWILELHRVAFKINTLQIRQFTQLLTNFFETGYLIYMNIQKSVNLTKCDNPFKLLILFAVTSNTCKFMLFSRFSISEIPLWDKYNSSKFSSFQAPQF